MYTLPFPDQIKTLQDRLRRNLPGVDAHLTMAPAYRQHPEMLSIRNKPCRKASVLALLFPLETETGILLTKRREHLNQHAGQVSFPGGRNEPGETLLDTALRETQEETGIAASSICILGALTPLYIPVSNFCVHPFVGALSAPPQNLTPHDDEVQRIIEMPLSVLADPRVKRVETWLVRGKSANIPFFGIDSETIWGATAMILAELLRLFDTEPELRN